MMTTDADSGRFFCVMMVQALSVFGLTAWQGKAWTAHVAVRSMLAPPFVSTSDKFDTILFSIAS